MSDDLIERLQRRAKHDDGSLDPLLLEAASCIRDLRARLATAEADAIERAARVLSRASEEIRALKPKADE